ncbi:polysaccharide biosynthesis/export family protein [Flavobacterium sp. AG291]|uniref:polysaccharide biosynthesis/export family protein n=1 Tax=Flavobacterium sp. AG291 TaxID=2184000 RepID=UPI001313E5E5|nr:polysaccharide biosynthesis/export family protein [Flavobacterium sp. AG291]
MPKILSWRRKISYIGNNKESDNIGDLGSDFFLGGLPFFTAILTTNISQFYNFFLTYLIAFNILKFNRTTKGYKTMCILFCIAMAFTALPKGQHIVSVAMVRNTAIFILTASCFFVIDKIKYLPCLLFLNFFIVAGLISCYWGNIPLCLLNFALVGLVLSLFIKELSSQQNYLSKKNYLFISYVFGFIWCILLNDSSCKIHQSGMIAYLPLIIVAFPIYRIAGQCFKLLPRRWEAMRVYKAKRIKSNNLTLSHHYGINVYIATSILLIIIIVIDWMYNIHLLPALTIVLVFFLVNDLLLSAYFKYHTMIKNAIKFVHMFFLGSLAVSCTSAKDVLYIQNAAPSYNEKPAKNQLIDKDDILSIKVISQDPEAAKFYNIGISEFSGSQNQDIIRLTNYLVDDKGYIIFPFLGKLSVTGKTVKELEEQIKQKLDENGQLLQGDIIIRILNSKFTILGEVKNPGTFSFSESRLSLFQALGTAGDLTINANRKDLRLIRTEDGIKKVYTFDLTSADVLNNEIGYIQKNDIVIVNPNKAKIKSAGLIGNTSVLLSAASLLLSALLLTK